MFSKEEDKIFIGLVSLIGLISSMMFLSGIGLILYIVYFYLNIF